MILRIRNEDPTQAISCDSSGEGKLTQVSRNRGAKFKEEFVPAFALAGVLTKGKMRIPHQEDEKQTGESPDENRFSHASPLYAPERRINLILRATFMPPGMWMEAI